MHFMLNQLLFQSPGVVKDLEQSLCDCQRDIFLNTWHPKRKKQDWSYRHWIQQNFIKKLGTNPVIQWQKRNTHQCRKCISGMVELITWKLLSEMSPESLLARTVDVWLKETKTWFNLDKDSPGLWPRNRRSSQNTRAKTNIGFINYYKFNSGWPYSVLKSATSFFTYCSSTIAFFSILFCFLKKSHFFRFR